ncbi:GGDEF domain-containing protein [Pseudoalteromonas sp. MMG005]|uniref:tetratricopeptide repeat-containing diguanylate cyclase n=1 Tax=Pseudoalteromonas sp. MMG005 TaxID=2822682 RepID=UPI001B3A64CF|nr:GGDEF domain-containing protein [Pseudoalteromonas sp. MMG005]MBQ4847365.1 diguanylate cyclase [Pseudoalteromonas sp. MMG005]
MKVLFFFLCIVISLLPLSTQASIPNWFSQYEQTLSQSPQDTLETLVQQHRTMQPGLERIYLTTVAAKLAEQLSKPLLIHLEPGSPLTEVEQRLLHAIQASMQNKHQLSESKFKEVQNLINEKTHQELASLVLQHIVWDHIKKGNYHSITRHLDKMNALAEAIDKPIIDPKYRWNLSAIVANHHGYHNKALTLYKKILGTRPNPSRQAVTFNNIGLTLMDMGQYDNAITHFKNALELRTLANNQQKIALTQLNLGIAYRKNLAFEQASSLLLSAQRTFTNLNNNYGVANSNIQLAKLHLAYEEPSQALTLLIDTLNILDVEQHATLLFDTHLTLAKTHLQLQQYDWALKAATWSLQLIKKGNDITHQLSALGVIIQIHAKLNQFEQAYLFQEKYIALEKTHAKNQNQQALIAVQTELKMSKAELKTIRLEQKNLQQTHKIQQLQYNQYRLWLTIACITLIVIFVWRSRNKQRYLAEHDTLTGAFNRAAMYKALSKYAAPIESEYAHALILLDLDHFKKINDTYGHPAGDQTLIQCCHTIKKAITQPHFISRIGGEEFVVFIPHIKKTNILNIVESARQTLSSQPVTLADHTSITVTASFAYYATNGLEHTKFASIYSALDIGLYQAKKQGRNCVVEVVDINVS